MKIYWKKECCPSMCMLYICVCVYVCTLSLLEKSVGCGELIVALFFFPQVFGDYYHFRHRRVVKRSLSEHRGTHIRLHTEPQVCVKCRVWIRLRTALNRHVFPNKLKGHVDKSLTRWSKKPKYWSHWDLNRSQRKMKTKMAAKSWYLRHFRHKK